MAKIRKIYDDTIKPDGSKQVIYPITTSKAVYDTNNVSLDVLLNEGYRFGGVVDTTDSSEMKGKRVFYLASRPGTYTNFGSIVVEVNELASLIYDGTTWSKGVFGNLSNFVNAGSYNSSTNKIELKNGSTVLAQIDATPFTKDGMVDTVAVSNGNLVITFNADANKQPISIPITSIFDSSQYYTKLDIDSLLNTIRTTINSKYSKPVNGIPKLDLSDNVQTSLNKADAAAPQVSVDAINAKIPSTASAQNQLADKNFVNSTVQTETATFRGNWETYSSVPDDVAYLPGEAADNNDYLVVRNAGDYAKSYDTVVGEYAEDGEIPEGIVVADGTEHGQLVMYISVQIIDLGISTPRPSADSSHDYWTPFTGENPEFAGTWRFKYVPNGESYDRLNWLPEYQVNEKPLTAEQLAAINSGITDSLVTTFIGKYEKPVGGIPASDLASNVIPDISVKADKVLNAINNNLASLDSSGNLKDAGVAIPSLPGNGGRVLAVNSSATALEWINNSGGGGGAGTLNTTATTAQPTNNSESLGGTVTLHKVAKTGTYSDLIGTPTIPDDKVFIATYNTTTQSEIVAAITAGKVVFAVGAINNKDSLLVLGQYDGVYAYFYNIDPDEEIVYLTGVGPGGWDVVYEKVLVSSSQISSWNGKYTKPSNGIPASDLASGVIPDDKVFIATYGTTTFTEIETAYNAGKAIFMRDNYGYLYTLSWLNDGLDHFYFYTTRSYGGVPMMYYCDVDQTDTWTVDSFLVEIPAISTDISSDATSDSKTTSPKAVKTFVESKGYGTGTLTGVTFNGASATVSGGIAAITATIPAEVTETTVANWGFTKNTGTYSKPTNGIPATDLESAVQTSLGKADTALQSFTETDPTVPSWAKASSKPSYNYSEIANTPTLGTAAAKDVPTSGNASTTQVVMGDDSRLTDARNAADVYSWAKAASKPSYAYSEITDTPTIPSAPGTLVTNATSGQTASAGEAMSGTITLHKISKTGSYNDLLNQPTIPTVPTISTNVATDKADNSKTTGAKAVYDEVHPAVATTIPSGGMLPNVMYRLGTKTGTVSFTMASATDNTIINHWYWTFETSTTAPTVTWPAAITGWIGGSAPTIEASKHYEISVLDGIGAFISK